MGVKRLSFTPIRPPVVVDFVLNKDYSVRLKWWMSVEYGWWTYSFLNILRFEYPYSTTDLLLHLLWSYVYLTSLCQNLTQLKEENEKNKTDKRYYLWTYLDGLHTIILVLYSQSHILQAPLYWWLGRSSPKKDIKRILVVRTLDLLQTIYHCKQKCM